jgi:hypothetical protein
VSRTLKLNPLLLGLLFFFLTFSSYISMLPVAGLSGTLSDVSFVLLSFTFAHARSAFFSSDRSYTPAALCEHVCTGHSSCQNR